MALNNISNAARSAMCDALVDLLDGGTTDASGDVQIYTAAFGTLLAELPLNNPAFGAASNGVATIATGTAVEDTSANATGTAAVCRFRDRDNTVVFEGTVTATSGGGDIELTSTSIVATEPVEITGGTITMPAS